jgi:hypothetical protein
LNKLPVCMRWNNGISCARGDGRNRKGRRRGEEQEEDEENDGEEEIQKGGENEEEEEEGNVESEIDEYVRAAGARKRNAKAF